MNHLDGASCGQRLLIASTARFSRHHDQQGAETFPWGQQGVLKRIHQGWGAFLGESLQCRAQIFIHQCAFFTTIVHEFRHALDSSGGQAAAKSAVTFGATIHAAELDGFSLLHLGVRIFPSALSNLRIRVGISSCLRLPAEVDWSKMLQPRFAQPYKSRFDNALEHESPIAKDRMLHEPRLPGRLPGRDCSAAIAQQRFTCRCSAPEGPSGAEEPGFLLV